MTTIIVVFGAQLKAQTAPLNSKPVSVNLNLSDVIGSSAASTSSIVSFNYSSIVDYYTDQEKPKPADITVTSSMPYTLSIKPDANASLALKNIMSLVKVAFKRSGETLYGTPLDITSPSVIYPSEPGSLSTAYDPKYSISSKDMLGLFKAHPEYINGSTYTVTITYNIQTI